jgi:hypothetical protein
MVQVVEHLLCKYEALNPNTPSKKDGHRRYRDVSLFFMSYAFEIYNNFFKILTRDWRFRGKVCT